MTRGCQEHCNYATSLWAASCCGCGNESRVCASQFIVEKVFWYVGATPHCLLLHSQMVGWVVRSFRYKEALVKQSLTVTSLVLPLLFDGWVPSLNLN